MQSREIVRRAIEFDGPPRLPFWQHGVVLGAERRVRHLGDGPRRGRLVLRPAPARTTGAAAGRHTEQKNMGQVVGHPLADWSALDDYRPPDPRNPFYFDRLEPLLDEAGDRYVVVTSHFNLIERLHMLRGFAETMEDFYRRAGAGRAACWT